MDVAIRGPEAGFDVVVVGAGVIGLAAAAALSRAGRTVLILEREEGIARGITSRNSQVVHAGIYYPKGSLKADLCVVGRRRLEAWCATKRVGMRRLGKLIVATRAGEEAILEDLEGRGRANGVTGLRLIDRAEISRFEPEVAALGALWSPETGIVDAHALSLSLLAAAESAGAILAVARIVTALHPRSFGWQVETQGGDGRLESIDAGLVVDAAGLEADRIARLAGLDVDSLGWCQRPCKGDYFTLGPGARIALEHLIYPVPRQAGLGIHATLDLAGRLRFGPDTEYVDEVRFDVDPTKAEGFRRAVARYLPRVGDRALVPDQAGIRPKLAGPGEGFRDFVIEETSDRGAPGFVACLGIESPGLTAALAIGDRIASFGSA
ncbi:MAG TPA: NAD(P)/FAD-dependent oxidoreductase [Deltaproteobacteria bacterium]|nr:NAD(P)/FAD-dependent oxidoreductase [Deltaproteobacteria bacterium]